MDGLYFEFVYGCGDIVIYTCFLSKLDPNMVIFKNYNLEYITGVSKHVYGLRSNMKIDQILDCKYDLHYTNF